MIESGGGRFAGGGAKPGGNGGLPGTPGGNGTTPGGRVGGRGIGNPAGALFEKRDQINKSTFGGKHTLLAFQLGMRLETAAASLASLQAGLEEMAAGQVDPQAFLVPLEGEVRRMSAGHHKQLGPKSILGQELAQDC